MQLSPKLQAILEAELKAGNCIDGEYINAYQNCENYVMLKYPFRNRYDPTEHGIEEFTNDDTHYPVGREYKEKGSNYVLYAPYAHSNLNGFVVVGILLLLLTVFLPHGLGSFLIGGLGVTFLISGWRLHCKFRSNHSNQRK